MSNYIAMLLRLEEAKLKFDAALPKK